MPATFMSKQPSASSPSFPPPTFKMRRKPAIRQHGEQRALLPAVAGSLSLFTENTAARRSNSPRAFSRCYRPHIDAVAAPWAVQLCRVSGPKLINVLFSVPCLSGSQPPPPSILLHYTIVHPFFVSPPLFSLP